ncbi:MAG TPA: alpha/beta fold hydrolase [Myxococcota bacterium]|jgi:pimeloyl-ACP methyl ester carboxylesterase
MRIAQLILLALFASFAGGCASLAIGYERGNANLSAGHDDANGIAYLERKPAGDADVVVMLHGFGANKDNWDDFCAAMPSTMWLLAPDLPGFGDSARDEHQSYDPEAEVQQLARFISTHGITRFHLLGNSYGGWVASAYALAHPEQIESLVLFDPAGIEPPGGFKVPPPTRTKEDFDRMLKDIFAKPPDMPDSLKAAFVEQAIKDQPFNDKIANDIRQRPGTVAAHLAELKVPVLVVWGDQDHVLNVDTAPLWRDRVPDHLVVIMRETGHCPMIERPAESAALVLRWWWSKNIATSRS